MRKFMMIAALMATHGSGRANPGGCASTDG